MKKLSILILAILYLGLSSGVVKNLHYCMGELSQVGYGFDDHDACGTCGMTEKEGCCTTELKIVKVDDSHQWVNPALGFNDIEISPKLDHLLVQTALVEQESLLQSYHSPPDRRVNSLYLHTGILRI